MQSQDRTAPGEAFRLLVVDQIVAVDGRIGPADGAVGIGAREEFREVGLIDQCGKQSRAGVVGRRLRALLPPESARIRLRYRQLPLRHQMLNKGEMPDFVGGFEWRGYETEQTGKKEVKRQKMANRGTNNRESRSESARRLLCFTGLGHLPGAGFRYLFS